MIPNTLPQKQAGQTPEQDPDLSRIIAQVNATQANANIRCLQSQERFDRQGSDLLVITRRIQQAERQTDQLIRIITSIAGLALCVGGYVIRKLIARRFFPT